jgi:hypothetical protein
VFMARGTQEVGLSARFVSHMSWLLLAPSSRREASHVHDIVGKNAVFEREVLQLGRLKVSILEDHWP